MLVVVIGLELCTSCRLQYSPSLPPSSVAATKSRLVWQSSRGVDTGGRVSWPLKICRRGQSMFSPSKRMSHSFIQNCRWISLHASSASSRMKYFCQKWKVKKNCRGAWIWRLDLADWPWPHILRQFHCSLVPAHPGCRGNWPWNECCCCCCLFCRALEVAALMHCSIENKVSWAARSDDVCVCVSSKWLNGKLSWVVHFCGKMTW